MKQIAFALLLSAVFMGCDPSKPAPKPAGSVPKASEDEMRKKINEAEAKNPCSEQNLRNASEEQKNKCDPTRGMMERSNPKAAPQPKK